MEQRAHHFLVLRTSHCHRATFLNKVGAQGRPPGILLLRCGWISLNVCPRLRECLDGKSVAHLWLDAPKSFFVNRM